MSLGIQMGDSEDVASRVALISRVRNIPRIKNRMPNGATAMYQSRWLFNGIFGTRRGRAARSGTCPAWSRNPVA